MNDRENLPAKPVTRDVTVPTDHHGSLVARGLLALQEYKKLEPIRNNQDELYRQAKKSLYWGPFLSWSEKNHPTTFAAFKILQQLAGENYGRAYFPLSRLYRIRRDIEDGQERAQHFAQLAVEWCLANQATQDVELWYQLGAIYNEGRDSAQMAISSDFALYQLGAMYKNGCGVTQDYVQAVFWFRKAAEQGHELAQLGLAGMYACGHGVEQDDEQYLYWFHRAAEQGGPKAQFDLGYHYELGLDPVEQDHQQAVYWFRKAAEQGATEAQDALERIGIDWENN